MLGANDKAWFNILQVARAVTLDYNINGMDLEEAGLCTTFEKALFHPPLRDERNMYERWINLDMIECLWHMLQKEKGKVPPLLLCWFVTQLKKWFSSLKSLNASLPSPWEKWKFL